MVLVLIPINGLLGTSVIVLIPINGYRHYHFFYLFFYPVLISQYSGLLNLSSSQRCIYNTFPDLHPKTRTMIGKCIRNSLRNFSTFNTWRDNLALVLIFINVLLGIACNNIGLFKCILALPLFYEAPDTNLSMYFIYILEFSSF